MQIFLLEDRDYALINVDHHMSNEQYGDINYVNTNAAAVGEIIYGNTKVIKCNFNEKI